MSDRGLKSVYFVGIIAGFLGGFVSLALGSPTDATVISAIRTGGIIGLLGLIGGLLRPDGGWHWGIALAIPLVALIGLSLAFAGEFGLFLARDLPVLVAVIVGGILGGGLGALARRTGKDRA